jgi:putative tricarboxylic transport membrane protein
MQRALLLVDGVALLLGAVYLWIAFGYPLGTMERPGPGLYPIFLGILFVIAAIGSLVTDLVKPAKGELGFPQGKDLGRFLMMLGGGATYVLLLPYAGHLVSAIILVFVALQAMGRTSWLMKICFTVGIALGSYYLFDVFLRVPLPRGIFF